ncbi:hypothetical protein ACIBCT_35425 [Streptosporangium sp. NPDC050855]|uniref:hypothetical protein n=1 Tax=Streptosporangium sp. NPDC050855 TaxID=3366194 RepID=UPI00379C505F
MSESLIPGRVDLPRQHEGETIDGTVFVIIGPNLISTIRESDMPAWLARHWEHEEEFAIYAVNTVLTAHDVGPLIAVSFSFTGGRPGYKGKVMLGPHYMRRRSPYLDENGKPVEIVFDPKSADA